MDQLDEIVKEFLVESYEYLDQLDQDLVALEECPDDLERLASIFRSIHTIKGTSGFLALPKLERVAHIGENLLVPLRDGKIKLNNEIADGLLAMLDAIRNILTNIESCGGEGEDDYSEVVAELERLRSGESEQPKSDSRIEAEPLPTKAIENKSEPATCVSTDQERPESPGAEDKAADKSDPVERNQSLADTTVRLDVHLLDRLMNLVGELVLARNQILQFSLDNEDSAMLAASQRLNHITTELQEGVMKTRMQPIRNAWNKLPRVVRDLSSSCGKHVNVKMEGADTELDKTILEAIKDPLTHIVRNSVDHGIESPEQRLAASKPEEGLLLLRAYHEGGQVNIEISDDGGGICLERVKQKALDRNLVTEDQLATMNERELTNLVLLPGFSTAAQVTNVSGRGVGMDVVKTNVEKIGGTVDLQSTPGQGTTVRIKIPLTLAIVPALIVSCDGDRYAIPQVSLLELVRLDSENVNEKIEQIHNVPTYRLRGRLLPLIDLREQLNAESEVVEDKRNNYESVNIVVLQADDRQFGLIVDEINDTQEIVVKPLGEQLKSIDLYAGATIMGDGTVSLILDVNGLAQNGNVLSENQNQNLNSLASSATRGSKESVSWLIVDPGDETRVAFELATVARLEEFPTTIIERVGDQHVVQYRDSIMPLVGVNASVFEWTNRDVLQVVVFNMDDRSCGVVVDRIIDVADEYKENNESESRIIGGRATRIVDLDAVVRQGLQAMTCPDSAA